MRSPPPGAAQSLLFTHGRHHSDRHACGAVVTDLTPQRSMMSRPLNCLLLDEHHVLVFPDQRMSNDELERFSEAFGRLGTDPWFIPIEGSDHIVEIGRDVDEEAPLFGEGWHSDWSFLDSPVATCLLGLTTPDRWRHALRQPAPCLRPPAR